MNDRDTNPAPRVDPLSANDELGATPFQQSDPYITLAEATKLAPGRPSANAVWRWARKGVKSRAGPRVYLRHIRAGGRILTTAAWVEQFAHDLAAADAEHFHKGGAQNREESPPERNSRREHDRARARLAAKGLL